MKKQQSGYIFNVASRSGKVGFAGNGGYGASKFGLVGLSESLYRELTPQGIKVTALCPAWVNTNMAREAGTPLEADEMIQPEDVFETIRWLLSLSSGACVKEVVITNPKSL
jgi:NAD(P)-dependent dehydrogenase (short-subunit alcohol dehydrogenase family)